MQGLRVPVQLIPFFGLSAFSDSSDYVMSIKYFNLLIIIIIIMLLIIMVMLVTFTIIIIIIIMFEIFDIIYYSPI